MRLIISFLAVLLVFTTSSASARDQVRAVGSSTVYPFVSVVAETFGRNTEFDAPIVEFNGTGGGFKFFCEGVGKKHPDVSNASRAIKQSEIDNCNKNGIKNIVEIKIGYDGIVLANALGGKDFSLTKEHIFKALAQKVPQNGSLVENPYKKWSDIDASLPDQEIEVIGPPPTSGTRDAFVEMVMETVCVDMPEFKAAYTDKKDRKKACHMIREDGPFVEAGENDNLIIQKLAQNENALGIFGFSFMDQNASIVKGAEISGVAPSFETIADGSYIISRPLYVYLKGENAIHVKSLKPFAKELVSEDAIGDEGYLSLKGLIPLSEEEKESARKKVEKL